MALIKCPECGREGVSDSALMCPGCGYSFANLNQQKKKKEKSVISQRARKPLILLLVVSSLVLLRMIILVAVCPSEKSEIEDLQLQSVNNYIESAQNSEFVSFKSLPNEYGVIYETEGINAVLKEMKKHNDVLNPNATYLRLWLYLIAFVIAVGAIAIDILILKKYEKKEFKAALFFYIIPIIVDVAGTTVILSAINKGSVISKSVGTYFGELIEGFNGYDDGLAYGTTISAGIILLILYIIACRFISKQMKHAVVDPDNSTELRR